MAGAIQRVETSIKTCFKEIVGKTNDLFTRVWSAVKKFFNDCAARFFSKQPNPQKNGPKATVLNDAANSLTPNVDSISSVASSIKQKKSISNSSAELSPRQVADSQNALTKDEEYVCVSYVDRYGSKQISTCFVPVLDLAIQKAGFNIYSMVFLWEALEKAAPFSVTTPFIDACQERVKAFFQEAIDKGSSDILDTRLNEIASEFDQSFSGLSDFSSAPNPVDLLSERLLTFAKRIKTMGAVFIVYEEGALSGSTAFVLIDKRGPKPLFYIIGSCKAPSNYVGRQFIRVPSNIDKKNLKRCLEGLGSPSNIQFIIKKPVLPQIDTPVDTLFRNGAAFMQFSGSYIFSDSNERSNEHYLTCTMLSLWENLEKGEFLDQNSAQGFIDACKQRADSTSKEGLEKELDWAYNGFHREYLLPNRMRLSEINNSLLARLEGKKTILGSLIQCGFSQRSNDVKDFFVVVDNRGPEPIFYLGVGAPDNGIGHSTISIFRKEIDFSKIPLGQPPYNGYLFKKKYRENRPEHPKTQDKS